MASATTCSRGVCAAPSLALQRQFPVMKRKLALKSISAGVITGLPAQLPRQHAVQVQASAGAPQLGNTQIYNLNKQVIAVPVAAVQKLPLPAQAAAFLAIYAALSTATVAVCKYGAPALAAAAPGFFAGAKAAAPLLGLFYFAVGVAHFYPFHHEIASMVPHQGAWGLWYLPGSAAFHTNWTGVAEIAGGLGVLLGPIPAVQAVAPWLQPAAALGLFVLTLAVTPANIYMFTHNAPGPVRGALPPLAHFIRLLFQVFFLTMFWGLYAARAHAPAVVL